MPLCTQPHARVATPCTCRREGCRSDPSPKWPRVHRPTSTSPLRRRKHCGPDPAQEVRNSRRCSLCRLQPHLPLVCWGSRDWKVREGVPTLREDPAVPPEVQLELCSWEDAELQGLAVCKGLKSPAAYLNRKGGQTPTQRQTPWTGHPPARRCRTERGPSAGSAGRADKRPKRKASKDNGKRHFPTETRRWLAST